MAKYALDPNTGQWVKIKQSHKARNFVLFPALALVGLFVIIGIASAGQNPASGSVPGNGPAATTAQVPATASQAGPVRLQFGDSHTWRGGETITVSQPKAYHEPNQFLQPKSGERYVSFDVTIRNNGKATYQVMETSITVQHAGRVAQQNYTAGDPLPNVEVPPGGQTTFTAVYSIGTDPGELQVSVKPNAFATETVFFVGQV